MKFPAGFAINESFVFVGCEAFELTPEMFSVRDAHRTLEFNWAMLDGGGIALRDRDRGSLPSGEGVIGEAMQQFSTMRETHDALWIKHRAGLIIALIERENPKRDALLGGLQQHLGSHWFGSVFSSSDLAQRFSASPAAPVRPMMRLPLILMGGGMLIIVVIAVLIAVLH